MKPLRYNPCHLFLLKLDFDTDMNSLRHLRFLLILVSLLLFPHLASADVFLVDRIEVKGLQRVPESTVLSYLPVKVGQKFNTSESPELLNKLYQTGFFSNLELNREGNDLIVVVHERPIIGFVRFAGNKKIPKDRLNEILKTVGIVDGAVYDDSKLKGITEGLKQAYFNLGYYSVNIEAAIKLEPRNRVEIAVNITEGKPVKIKSISILGANTFSQSRLLDNFKLTTPNLFTLISHDDNYSEQQLNNDLKKLTDFYLDRGYLRFQILSKKAVISPDKSSVSISITVSEGAIFRVKGFDLSDSSLLQKESISKLISIKPGQIFSRKSIVSTNDSIAKYLANEGYAFPVINAVPTIDDLDHTVFLHYEVSQGRRIYVRRINVTGDDRTQNIVLRRELRQLEGSVFSLSKIDESKRRLANLPYIDPNSIEATPEPVPGSDDLVDLNYHVKEMKAGRASANGGYSDTEGFLYGANIVEPNFLGTGKLVSVGFQQSAFSDLYNIGYTNPYYTLGGMSRGFNLYYSHTTPGHVNITSYVMNSLGGDMSYGMPISEFDTLNFGYGYDHIEIKTTSTTATQVINFLNQHGNIYDEFKLNAGWNSNNYDRIIFPTTGFNQDVNVEAGVPIVKKSLSYYTVSYDNSWYYPLTLDDNYILNLHSNVAYGNGYGDINQLPFFKNFYAGGFSSVPGFEGNSLGPQDQNGNALGGNVLAVGGANLIFPNYISDKIRTALAFNIGNVYQNQFSLAQLRMSVGLIVNWNSPIGLVGVSLATPLNKKPGDHGKVLDFSFGASI